jgi:hypothetical protein
MTGGILGDGHADTSSGFCFSPYVFLNLWNYEKSLFSVCFVLNATMNTHKKAQLWQTGLLKILR